MFLFIVFWNHLITCKIMTSRSSLCKNMRKSKIACFHKWCEITLIFWKLHSNVFVTYKRKHVPLSNLRKISEIRQILSKIWPLEVTYPETWTNIKYFASTHFVRYLKNFVSYIQMFLWLLKENMLLSLVYAKSWSSAEYIQSYDLQKSLAQKYGKIENILNS